jgi:hypothetical protein
MEYSVFKEQIATSPLLASMSKIIATSVPVLEFLAVLLLIIPAWRLKGLYLSLLLMSAFTVYIVGILLLNDKLPCSCGGIISELSWTQHVVFNCFFIGIAIAGIFFQKRSRKEYSSQLALLAPTN